MNLFEISDEYRRIADDSLKESKLLSVLSKYGRVEFEGAYAGNVMYHGDIDIKVIRDKDFSSDEAFEILKDIRDTCGQYFRSLFIMGDWDDPRFGQQFPNGQYIGLKTKINSERWKFDIWFVSEAEDSGRKSNLNICKIDLTEEQRLKILEFKKFRKEKGLEVSGQEIYVAVLEENYSDPIKFFTGTRKADDLKSN